MLKSKILVVSSIILILLSLFFFSCSSENEKSAAVKKSTPLYTILWAVQGYNDTITTATFSPDGKMIASGADALDKKIYISDSKTGKLIKSIDTPQSWYIAFSPDGKTLAGGSLGTIKIWETDTWEEIKEIKWVSISLRSLVFSPDGKILVSSGLDSRITLWNPVSGKKVKEIDIDGMGWFNVFSPDGKYLATGGCSDIKVIEILSGKIILTLKGYIFDPMNTANNDTFAALFTPDGLNLITGGADSVIRVWEIPSGKLIKKFEKQDSVIRELGITPDGKILVSANWIDLKIYDLVSGRNVRVITEIKQTSALDISPDGKSAVTGGIDRILRVWKLAN